MSLRVRALSSGLALIALGAFAASAAGEPRSVTPLRAKAASDRLSRRLDAARLARSIPLDHVPEGADARARESWSAIPRVGDVATREPGAPEPPPGPGPAPKDLAWTFLGPAPLDVSKSPTSTPNMGPTAGRAAALAIDPTDSKTLYAGYSMGGVWKSTDGGATWTPTFDAEPTLAIGALAIDPTNPKTIWAGSGEPALYAGYGGKGVFKSTDGAKTWKQVGGSQFDGLAISRIVLDGSDIYLTALFAVEGRGEACTNVDLQAKGQGLWKSSDGGATWKQLKDGSLVDLEVVTSVMPRRIFVSSTKAAFVSNDAGATWEQPMGLPTDSRGRPEITVSAKNPNVVYVGMGVNGVSTMFVSQDAGKTFAQMPGAPDYCPQQCDWDNSVVVDPNDEQTVYVGGSICGVWGTTDGLAAQPAWTDLSAFMKDCGKNLENWYLGFVHPDVHNIVFDPKDSSIVYAITDGGIARSTDKGGSWERLNQGVGTLQFYGLCVDPTDVHTIYGGAQDNGSFKTRPKGALTWDGLVSGDGGGCVVDPKNPKIVLVSNEEGTLFLSTTGFSDLAASNTVFDASPYCQKGDPGCGDTSAFIPPIAVDPVRGGAYFYGTTRLWRNDAAGAKKGWKAASPDLTRGSGSVPCGAGGVDDVLTAIAVAPSDGNVIVTGSEAGMIQLTTDGGKTWNAIDAKPLPHRWVSGLAFDASDAKTIYAGFSGFSAATPSTPGHVFVSHDAGKTWSLADIPSDVPVDAIVAHPSASGLLYVGTDLGALVSKDAGKSWEVLGGKLPAVAVYALAFHQASATLIAGTHGRSAWSVAFTPGALTVMPSSLTFMATEGGDDPAAQTVTVAQEDAYGSTVPWTSSASDAWITGVDPMGAAAGQGTVETVKVTIAGLAAGSYDGKVSFSASGKPAVDVPVHLVIAAKSTPPPPTMNPTTQTPDKGCGCRVAGDPERSPLALAVPVALAGLFAARRRRRA